MSKGRVRLLSIDRKADMKNIKNSQFPISQLLTTKRLKKFGFSFSVFSRWATVIGFWNLVVYPRSKWLKNYISFHIHPTEIFFKRLGLVWNAILGKGWVRVRVRKSEGGELGDSGIKFCEQHLSDQIISSHLHQNLSWNHFVQWPERWKLWTDRQANHYCVPNKNKLCSKHFWNQKVKNPVPGSGYARKFKIIQNIQDLIIDWPICSPHHCILLCLLAIMQLASSVYSCRLSPFLALKLWILLRQSSKMSYSNPEYEDIGSCEINSSINSLMNSWRTELNAPEILPYREALVVEIQEILSEQEVIGVEDVYFHRTVDYAS